jgi:hypothetical protein
MTMTMRLKHKANGIGDADVAVSYAGWTLTVDHAGIDNLFDDTNAMRKTLKFPALLLVGHCCNDIR